jgi:hypothetical protein
MSIESQSFMQFGKRCCLISVEDHLAILHSHLSSYSKYVSQEQELFENFYHSESYNLKLTSKRFCKDADLVSTESILMAGQELQPVIGDVNRAPQFS